MYDPSSVEAKWQAKWAEEKVYEVNLKSAKKPFFTHVMFPYPSGDKLHVGHWYNFGPADSYARYKRMQGYDVFSPMGFDAFGLPAENYAIKTGVPPQESIPANIETMIRQLKRIGCMYDWNRMVNTSHSSYYQWTQWIFLQMFSNGLAYKKKANVNFCPKCQTVLANEQVWEGKCERCDSDVIQKAMEQWFLKTTQYAERLLAGLDGLDWPEKTKIMQRNWIGKKEGIDVTYVVEDVSRGIIEMPVGAEVGMPVKVSPRINSGANIEMPVSWGINSPANPMRTVHLVFTPKGRRQTFEDPLNARRILSILDSIASRHSIVLHEACAMPDHVHVLVSFDSKLHLENDVVKRLKGASAREYLKEISSDAGHLWGEGNHFEDVASSKQFAASIQYIQKNPSEDGLPENDRILSKLPITITCFTTRPDTNFGATFIVLAPEHPFVTKIVKGEIASDKKSEVSAYVQASLTKTELERQEEGMTKTGAFTGHYVLNTLNGKKLPVWVSDFVLAGFGTGAVVGVPGHDLRDFQFAIKFGIPVVRVVVGPDGDTSEITKSEQVQEEAGIMVNSAFLDGMEIHQAKEKIKDHMEANGWGKRVVTYRLRDWSIGRQRYWGAPIPVVYDPEGKPHPIPLKHLPWILPQDVEFKPKGTAPLAQSRELFERTEKIFGKGWTPEVDTMDTFVCSSFYSFMYLGSSHEGGEYEQLPVAKNIPVDPKIEKKWMPVSMYIGGAEHACMHLIYARFVSMALTDFGCITHAEQYQKLVHQGVITNQGAKMSKSKGNVVSPDAFVDRHGSDVFRMYLMFMGPFTEGGDWSDTGIKGVDRFVQRIWKLCEDTKAAKDTKDSKEVIAALHRAIKKVGEDIERLHFNTAIAALMELLNLLEKQTAVAASTMQAFAKIIAPMAPHLAEEIWEKTGGKGFIIDQQWPEYDPKLLVATTVVIAVQVNGKLRGTVAVASDASEQDIITAAKAEPNVRKFIEGVAVKKEIYVQGKLVSLVI